MGFMKWPLQALDSYKFQRKINMAWEEGTCTILFRDGEQSLEG